MSEPSNLRQAEIEHIRRIVRDETRGGAAESPPQLGITRANEGTVLGFTLLGWTIFTVCVWAASLRVNVAMFALFTDLMILFILLGIGFLAKAPGFVVAVGYAGIVLLVRGWYTSAAGLLGSVFGRDILPVGRPLVR